METSPAPALDTATRLALERTRVAYDRTLLAWVRTAASLITFGFSAYKIFEITAPRTVAGAIGPRGFGLMLASIGVGALLIAAFEYRRDMAVLTAQYDTKRGLLAVGTATLVGALGLIAVLAMWLRW